MNRWATRIALSTDRTERRTLRTEGWVQAALVDQAKRGDAEAFDSLARMVGDRCMAIAFRILRDADLAEDAVQTAFITAWRELRSLRNPSSSNRGSTGSSPTPAMPRPGIARAGRKASGSFPSRARTGSTTPDRGRSRSARTGPPKAHRRAARRPGLPPLPRALDFRGGGANRYSRRDREVPPAPRDPGDPGQPRG